MANSYGTATALSNNANSAASASYTDLTATTAIDFGSAPPHECFIEVSLQASAATSGNKQAVLYITDSVDGTNFSIAPSTTQAPNARLLGVVSLPDTTAVRSVAFPVSPLFGGALPQKIKVYVQNDCGVAFAASGQVGQYRTETFG